MSESGRDVAERLTIAPGDYSDVCPLCGIHRQNAGFLRATCGDGYLKPGCFVLHSQASDEGKAQ